MGRFLASAETCKEARGEAIVRRPRPTKRLARSRVAILFALALTIAAPQLTTAQQKKRDLQKNTGATSAAEDVTRLEAVVTTDLGVIRFEFFPDKAPRLVEHFIKQARAGSYDGLAFFHVSQQTMIQGGDSMLKNPAAPPDETNDLKHTRGSVSGGAQFFISTAPRADMDGRQTIFGQVTEGIDVADRISLVQTDASGLALTPVKIRRVTIEPRRVEPFKEATLDQMRKDVLLRTSFGEITVQMDPELAPEHVRNFLKLVESGWYDRTAFHRIVPGFVIQGGAGETRAGAVGHWADRYVRPLKGEFTNTLHIRGTLSMARTSDPNSATTSFFIMLGPAPHLDRKYSVFGKVIGGFDVLERIAKVARNGETPLERIELIEAVIKP